MKRLAPPRTDVARVAISLAGTDHGTSGISTCIRALLPRIHRDLDHRGVALTAIGAPADLEPYDLSGVDRVALPPRWTRPAPSAVHAMLLHGRVARDAGAEAMLMPAGNRRACLTSPVPTVTIVHDLAQAHVADKYDPLRMAYVNRLLPAMLRRSAALTAVSAATQRDVRTLVGRDALVVSNGVDARRFAQGRREAASARERLALSRPYILYVARLEHPGKNHLRLLRAFARAGLGRSHDLVLAGKDWGAGAAIDAEARDLGIDSQVQRLGFVADEVLPGLVAGADAVAMVGLHEGFGLPAAEALAAGRPVVASSTGALPEVVGDLGLLVDPHDVGSMARGLRAAVFDDPRRRRVDREGFDHARRFDWDHAARVYVDLLLEHARSPR